MSQPLTIDRAIFITNTFADAHPAQHKALWAKFEQEVPAAQRSGFYGSENLAYIKWLKKQNHPVFQRFANEHISIMTI
jgi:hypothetical protein